MMSQEDPTHSVALCGSWRFKQGGLKFHQGLHTAGSINIASRWQVLIENLGFPLACAQINGPPWTMWLCLGFTLTVSLAESSHLSNQSSYLDDILEPSLQAPFYLNMRLFPASRCLCLQSFQTVGVLLESRFRLFAQLLDSTP